MNMQRMTMQNVIIQLKCIPDKYNVKRQAHLILLFFIIIFLQGCPIPAFYYLSGRNDTKLDVLYSDGAKIVVKGAHPWRDTQRKFVIIQIDIKNNDKVIRICNFSDFELQSGIDTFQLNTRKGVYANKDFVHEKLVDTIAVGETQRVELYFVSSNLYSRKEYWKTLESDTLRFRVKGSDKGIELVGRDNRRVNKK